MNQNFNIAVPGATSGIDALMGGTGRTNKAPEGLFSSLVSVLGGNGTPKISDLVQIGAPAQTGEAWINLQMGDASLSLSSQALTTAMSPEKMASMVPGMLEELQLDDMARQGLANLGETVREAIETPQNGAAAPQNPATLTNSAMLGLQEIAQQTGAPQAQQTAAQLLAQAQASTNAQLNNNAQPGTANSASALPDENLQPPALAKALSGQNQGTGTPLTAEQLASRDSLAAQLQRQMTSNTEQQQLREQARVASATQNTTASGQNSSAPNTAANSGTPMPAGFAASLSQLPFVQTREVLTQATDPALLAQTSGQTAAQREQAMLFQPVKAAYQSPKINLPHMAVAIARNFNAGTNNFQIRLDPAELGRVNIQLSLDEGGNVHAKMLVERPETLQLLQQDARALERALSQAGLDGKGANLEFFLNENPFSGDGFNNSENDAETQHNKDDQSDTSNTPDTAIAAYKGSISPGGVSLWI